MPSISEGDELKLSIFIFLLEKIIAILFNKPIWFSVYVVIVNSCLPPTAIAEFTNAFILFSSVIAQLFYDYLNLISPTLFPWATIGNTLFSFPTITSNK